MSTSYHSLTTNQTIVQRNRSSTSEIDLDILRSSMTGDPTRVCVFCTGLYEAKPKRKATVKIDATQTGSLFTRKQNRLFCLFICHSKVRVYF